GLFDRRRRAQGLGEGRPGAPADEARRRRASALQCQPGASGDLGRLHQHPDPGISRLRPEAGRGLARLQGISGSTNAVFAAKTGTHQTTNTDFAGPRLARGRQRRERGKRMATTKTRVGVPWDGRTAYERWVEDDLKLDLHRGYSASSLRTVPLKPWAERGISAAFYDITGAESLAGLYVGEVAPGQSSKPARQLC